MSKQTSLPKEDYKRQILAEVDNCDLVKIFQNSISMTHFTNLRVDESVHEFLQMTAKQIAEEANLTKLNKWYESVSRLISYVLEQINKYDVFLFDLKSKAKHSMLSQEDDIKMKLKNSDYASEKIKIQIVEQYIVYLKRTLESITQRRDTLKSLVINKSKSY